jgi:hypothetical protein
MAQIISGTDGTVISSWTTAGRPASPSTAQFGYNTSLGALEIYTGTAWVVVGDQVGSYATEYLIVAGGGGGASRWSQTSCGGSGAGGVLNGSFTVTSGIAYTMTVGAGGAGYTTTAESEATITAASGSNSSAFSQTASGGGGGVGGNGGTAGSGGSGGGAGSADAGGSAGSGTAGQGFAGGSAVGSGANSGTRKDAFKVNPSGSIVLPTTQSVAPSWTGTNGEIIPATVGGVHLLYMWMAGAWRSSSFN